MTKLSWAKMAFGVFLLCATTAIALSAQTFTTLHSFDYTDGAAANAALVQATDGNLYGTTFYGGTQRTGTIFQITSAGTLTTLYSFCSQSNCADGSEPYAGLIQATDGNLYGTTTSGGSNRLYGTVFEFALSGTLTTLHSFNNVGGGGANPKSALVEAADGNLYGTTYDKGTHGYGTAFKIMLNGTLKTLYQFCSQNRCTDGEYPEGALIQAADGNFYGTTAAGGVFQECDGFPLGCGTVFRITPAGRLTTLYEFCSQSGCTDGESPLAGLVQASNGNLYGTTSFGGAFGYGAVFKITPAGKLTTLYSFCSQSGCTDGEHPYAALIQATDGNFYGTTYEGGTSPNCGGGCGTIFKITPTGKLTTLYNFCSQSGCADGNGPTASLIQGTDGNFYGTTAYGGNAWGTIFSLSVGLGRFVKTQPTSGKAGSAVSILGTNLTGATSVSFNGTAATFTVVSSSLITTSVPSGATTGTVQVVTPSGTLSSNVPFRVLP
ncbi:MAG TPA: choice-of-anchor tandem repeat GloVer-containing protein [Terriglobia bacterium]|nr:choice-of-anchor tandem repeat GloVer-containing protein [Terriglobia bacterium]